MTDTPARLRKTTLSRPAPLWEAGTWGPYFDALLPPQEVSPWIAWKIRSAGAGVARRLWDQRERLRGEYEDIHGTDRALWPVQHPGVVLDAMPSTAHGACLGCQWFDVRGHSMRHSDWFERASIWPHRHQLSNGVFLDGRRSSVVLGRSCSRPRSSSRQHRPRSRPCSVLL